MKITLLLVSGLLHFTCYGQVPTRLLNCNNNNATVSTGGHAFKDFNSGSSNSGYMNSNYNRTLSYNMFFWFGGTTTTDTTKILGGIYPIGSDVFP